MLGDDSEQDHIRRPQGNPPHARDPYLCRLRKRQKMVQMSHVGNQITYDCIIGSSRRAGALRSCTSSVRGVIRVPHCRLAVRVEAVPVSYNIPAARARTSMGVDSMGCGLQQEHGHKDPYSLNRAPLNPKPLNHNPKLLNPKPLNP